MLFYVKFYVTSDAYVKISILMFFMCNFVEESIFSFFDLKMGKTPQGGIFAYRNLSFLEFPRKDLHIYSEGHFCKITRNR